MVGTNKRVKYMETKHSYTVTSLNHLRMTITAQILPNIYTHVDGDTAEKVRRARAIATEIIKQELINSESENNEITKALSEAIQDRRTEPA